MPREYRHIKQYEKELTEQWEQGKTLREIADNFGFTKKQVQEFKTRYNRKQRMVLSAKNSADIMYTPIKKLLSVLPHDISNDSASEFDVFEKYVFSLESQKNLMSEIISENKFELSDKFLIQLMTSTISKTQIKGGVVNYGLTNIKFPIVTFVILFFFCR